MQRARARRASARGASRRGSRAARPSGTPSARARSRGPSRRAGAGRRRAAAGRRSSSVVEAEHRAPPRRRAARSPAFGVLRSFRPKAMFSRTRHVRVERVVLEHHRDVAVARRQIGDVAVADRGSCPSVISSSPAIIRSSVDLPQPDGPTSTMNSPSAIVEARRRRRRATPPGKTLLDPVDGRSDSRRSPFVLVRVQQDRRHAGAS